MTRILLALGAALFLGGAARCADDKVFSGPQAGEKLPEFKILGVYGDQAGKDLEPIKDADGKPTLLIFMHKVTRPGAAVVRALTTYGDMRSKDGLKVYVVYLHEDKTKGSDYLKTAEKSLGFKGTVGVSPDGLEGPGKYGLNSKVELTILVAKEGKVTANFALVQPSVKDTPGVADAIVKQVGGEAPKEKDLEKWAYPGQGRPPERKP